MNVVIHPANSPAKLAGFPANGRQQSRILPFILPNWQEAAAAFGRESATRQFSRQSVASDGVGRQVRPYLVKAFPSVFTQGVFNVRTVTPERTFWEKAMLLHEETFRTSGAGPKARLARHYYDLWCLVTKGVGEKAFADRELFARIAAHRAVFFRRSKDAQTSLLPGALRIIPLPDQMAAWKQDYQTMREDMFFGTVPEFDEIIRVMGDFERRFNRAV
jgi:hypothetical protein